MNTEIRVLNDAELETVSGGMDCKTAQVVAKIYSMTGDILGAAGDRAGAIAFYGRAVGVLEGGCT
jgi:hypothetical protein